jgi:hypothetical protein
VPGYARPEDNRLRTVLVLPFQRQRDYWGELARPARSDVARFSPRRLTD